MVKTLKKFEVWVLAHLAKEFDKYGLQLYPTRSEALRAAISEKTERMKIELEA
jgi:metal-responsive CopG/Arc/MetJ family transcriptional regulator